MIIFKRQLFLMLTSSSQACINTQVGFLSCEPPVGVSRSVSSRAGHLLLLTYDTAAYNVEGTSPC